MGLPRITSPQSNEEVHFEDLKESTDHIEQEARMVLPGIQALFGFQLIAAFNGRFHDLRQEEQIIHWFALGLTALSTIFTIAPAAFHRIAEPGFISRRFVQLANRWIRRGMSCLALSTCVDFYLIGKLVTGKSLVSLLSAFCLFIIFRFYWSIYPKLYIKKQWANGKLDF